MTILCKTDAEYEHFVGQILATMSGCDYHITVLELVDGVYRSRWGTATEVQADMRRDAEKLATRMGIFRPAPAP